ncbi:hypothetical protein [Caulobacter sp. NIBR2454]|uniref:hypothetical protein n=1 Tax=Caulobacter sp. NIBR2454 TaxID=3015996 RepID=UPI0022B5F1B2|nr:hypothetical protein [Caulobacter sp. NIBR2454]
MALAPDLAQRFEALATELGGPSAVIERAMLMAPLTGRKQILAEPLRGEAAINVPFSRAEMTKIDQERRTTAMSKGAWVRAVVRARLERAPQFSWEEAAANSSVRVELQRIGYVLRRAVDVAEADGADAQAIGEILACWAQARRQLEALRAALVGNLLYWSPADG